MKLFVYGTLKQGHGNHRRLATARFIGAAVSAAATYRMHDSGFPVLVDEPLGARVSGELYEVDRATLTACDRLESHPYWYRRRKRRFVTEDGTTHKAWVYIVPENLATYPRVSTPVLSWPFHDYTRVEDADDDETGEHDDAIYHQ